MHESTTVREVCSLPHACLLDAHFSYFALQLIKSPIKIHFSSVINCSFVNNVRKRKKEVKGREKLAEKGGFCEGEVGRIVWMQIMVTYGEDAREDDEILRMVERVTRQQRSLALPIFFAMFANFLIASMMKCWSVRNRFIIRW